MQKSRYLTPSDEDKKWGVTVSTVGYEDIPPRAPYPARGHADGYFFDVAAGRTLGEYQLLYVVEGEGTFASSHQESVRVREGSLILLFPGEWHTYCPDKATGWKCHWIGFGGPVVDARVEAGFMQRERPVRQIGFSDEVARLYDEAYVAASLGEPGVQQHLAGIVGHIVGLMYMLERRMTENLNHTHANIIRRARLRIDEGVESSLSIRQVAEELGLSYSNFRKLFKEFTGFSPATYQQQAKMQRAKELLSTTGMSIKEIAYRLNFESPDYFSVKFRQKTGRKPTDFRPKD